MKQAFSYLRVSSIGQVSGDGFTRQSIAIKDFAKTQNFKIVQEFRERGVPGKTELENRPALQDLISALHSNGTRIVLIENLSRLARDLMVQESIIHDFQKNGFEIVSVAEPDLCSTDPSRKCMRQVMGAFAEYEKSMLVAKLRGSRIRAKAKTGKCEGRKSYGENPGEKEVLARIMTLSLEMSANAVATKLNAEGIRSRSGGIWFGSNLVRIIRAEKKKVNA